ncbi:MAG: hypothetical protein ACLFP1_08215 [Candidatus Goldiibacteriota bacterium]
MRITSAAAAMISGLTPALQKEIHNCIKIVCRTRKENYPDKGIVRIKENYYKVSAGHFSIYFHTDSKQFINIIELKEKRD